MLETLKLDRFLTNAIKSFLNDYAIFFENY